MKCRQLVDGKECGVDLSPNANFCTECAQDVRTGQCSSCSVIVKETQKFCHNCRWKIEDKIFVTETLSSGVENSGDSADHQPQLKTPVVIDEETDTESKERNASEKIDESLLHNHNETLDNAKETAKSSDDFSKLKTDTENRENNLMCRDDNNSSGTTVANIDTQTNVPTEQIQSKNKKDTFNETVENKNDQTVVPESSPSGTLSANKTDRDNGVPLNTEVVHQTGVPNTKTEETSATDNVTTKEVPERSNTILKFEFAFDKQETTVALGGGPSRNFSSRQASQRRSSHKVFSLHLKANSTRKTKRRNKEMQKEIKKQMQQCNENYAPQFTRDNQGQAKASIQTINGEQKMVLAKASEKAKKDQEKSRIISKEGDVGSLPSNAGSREDGCVHICFHAILSPTILLNHKKDTVFVKIKEQPKDSSLTFKRMIEHGYVEYEGMVTVEKGEHRPVVVTYNYYVNLGGKHIVDEFIYHHGDQDFTSRAIPMKTLDHKEVYHQYDGVIRPKPVQEKEKPLVMKLYKRFTTWIGSDAYQKLLREDAEISFKTFLPNGGSMNGEELLTRIENIIFGLRKMYCIQEKLWNWSDFDKIISKLLTPYLETGITGLVKSRKHKTNFNSRIINLTTATTIVFLKETYKVDIYLPILSNLCANMLPDIRDKEKCCAEMAEIKKTFSKTGKKVTDCLLKNVKSLLKNGNDYSWIYCIPMLHYLQDKYQPFHAAPDDTKHSEEIPIWWGIAEFKKELDIFKGRTMAHKLFKQALKVVLPYFELDYLLPRTLVASLTFKDLTYLTDDSALPVDTLLAAVHYYITSYNILNSSQMQDFKKIFSVLCTILTKERPQRVSSFDELTRLYRICGDVCFCVMFGCTVDPVIRTRFWISLSEIFFIIGDMFFKSLHMNQSGQRQLMFDPDDAYKKICDEIGKELCLAEHDSYWSTETWIQIWNEAFQMRIPDGKVKKDLLQQLKNRLRTCLKERRTADKLREIIEVYCGFVETYAPGLQDALGDYALEAVDLCVNMSQDDYQQMEGSRLKHYGQLMSHVFERNLDENSLKDKKSYIQHAITWSPFSLFVKMYKNNDYVKALSKTCLRYMVNFIQTINCICEELLNGTITVEILSLLQSEREHFVTIVREINAFQETDVLVVLEIREKELSSFRTALADVKQFVYTCKKIEGITDDLEDSIKFCSDNKQVQMKHVCNVSKSTVTVHVLANGQYSVPKNVSDEMQHTQKLPSVIAFGLDENAMRLIPQILQCIRAHSFNQVWTKTGREAKKKKKRKLKVIEVLTEVWKQSYESWIELCKKLKAGDLLFTEFEEYFNHEDVDNAENLKMQLCNFSKGDDTSWISKRFDQFQNHKLIFSCLQGARAIKAIVEKYQLKGDFSHILEIINITSGADAAMKTFDDSLVKACSILRGIDEKKVESLVVFSKCSPLVTWLRKSVKGLKELKVFVELASMSAGETDIEVDRVQFLYAATTGYAPLIFNLDESCGDMEFIERCEMVWKELEADSKLPTKLRDTYQYLDWLKTVEKSHGSVEVSSLSQTKAINANGIYKVGNPGHGPHPKIMKLKEVLKLDVTNGEYSEEANQNDIQDISYNYDQLLDLQSRLMLVAGKAEQGKDEVDRFMQIFDAIARLGNIYIKLVADGCVLFNQWHATFFCDKRRPTCALLHFGYGKDMLTIKGRTDTQTEDISTMIPKFANIFESYHTKWLAYINDKRKTYPLLNFFTTDQIVIMQQQMVRLGTLDGPSPTIYPLLSAVKNDCTRSDLIKAMEEAKLDVIARESSETAIRTETANDPADPETVYDEKIQEVMNSGFSFSLAKEAVARNDTIEDAIDWCYDNDERFIEANEINPENSKREFTGWTNTEQSMTSLTSSLVSELDLKGRNDFQKVETALKTLWQTFLDSISSSVSDYLSIEHLCLILKRLADHDNLVVNRTLQSYLRQGEPNLIICEQSEIYSTVLSMYSHEIDEPLPQSDEVLLCTPESSLESVDIFWRRVLEQESNKVYCLVNVGLLDYEVSEKAEKTLQRLLQNAKFKGFTYRLVVICSTENENKSLIVRALAKYHRNQLPVHVNKLREYVQLKLNVNSSLFDVTPASFVDFDRCTVRVVKSWRAGVGKTLFKERMTQELDKLLPHKYKDRPNSITFPLHERTLDIDNVMEVLLKETPSPGTCEPRIYHFDISHEVQDGVDNFIFQLLILGCLHHSTGYVWRKSAIDYYIIESMPLITKQTHSKTENYCSIHQCLDILPSMLCRSPQESLSILCDNRKPSHFNEHDRVFDLEEFKSTTFQRPYQYLKRLDANIELHDVKPDTVDGEPAHCLKTLLSHCGIEDPSWSELFHFVSFLDKQLQDFEVSNFCSAAVLEDLPGFPQFVMKFIIQMSRDFATRSLKISEETPLEIFNRTALDEENTTMTDNVLELYQMRRKWETSPHPYLFFNPDGHSMTFLGFNIDKRTGNLVDLQTKTILEKGIMGTHLFDGLRRNNVNLTENYDTLPRCLKIKKLCDVMGVEEPHDPDETFELTTDNVKKILAIYMRFRCGIPVIIMGETGCGKTRLIRFMCDLQKPPENVLQKEGENENEEDANFEIQNMILMKVHGGTKSVDIIRKVEKAEEIARQNAELIGKHKFLQNFKHMYTVLFFDEANTTEAIGVIKEIMCDKTIQGRPIEIHQRLKIVAACNPYRKHSDELIKRLERAGLGYHVDADNTSDKLGRVPMRRLVYRVQPLPHSMLPLVWDFGQLNVYVEEMYIRQMVLRKMKDRQIPYLENLDRVISKVLTVSQEFMRQQEDECSFVSLRDVDRVLDVMSWFYRKTFEEDSIFQLSENDYSSDEEDMFVEGPIDHLTRSFVLALGVCYHACLRKRKEYRHRIAPYFKNPLQLPGGAQQIEEEIERCQTAFLKPIDLAQNIAKNKALKENVFMMIICIELRIPMFLVGKPGSSKSLAKAIVADAMQGNAAHHEFFKNFKQVQMSSFQCSPLSTPDGIVGTFAQCSSYQKDKDLDRFVSVVVLDEIGLAEDSPRMPLKTLHPLLEDGCPNDETPLPYKKVAFIGISNWALDPAKMNRGILVQREVPDKEELIKTAYGICSADEDVQIDLGPMIPPMAASYLQLFTDASNEMREFFGLRDFYSLIKMLYGFVSRSKEKPTFHQLKHSILRNFGGLEGIDPVAMFLNNLSSQVNENEEKNSADPECSPAGMIQACLKGDDDLLRECRYLLLLIENYGALSILQQELFAINNAVVIFGSSFPSDQEYTQICRNINRIKVCMETGSTVILLNLENLYESLYDALNQYYVEFGGERYVDLGLGSHRVKCRVHQKFRLIVVAEKQIVYTKFPIPLINRLEKHFVSMKTMLTAHQLNLSNQLLEWAGKFSDEKSFRQRRKQKEIGEAFIGYHADTCPAIIKKISKDTKVDYSNLSKYEEQILEQAKSVMLWCATPAAVLLAGNDTEIKIYFNEQQHESLAECICSKIFSKSFLQITTNSRILSSSELDDLCKEIPIQKENIHLLTLQSFHTEQQFSRQVRNCFVEQTNTKSLLIIQSEHGDQNSELIACARYSIQRELQEIFQNESMIKVCVIFLIQLTGMTGRHFSGFQCGIWQSIHIDDVRPFKYIPPMTDMYGQSVASIISEGVHEKLQNLSKLNIKQQNDEDEVKQEKLEKLDNSLERESMVLKRTLKIEHFILDCIQRALAALKDPEDDSLRTTERLKNTLSLMDNSEDSKSILPGILKHVMKLINEKERLFGSTSNWLSVEVSKPQIINKAGTFRKSIILCLESRILPLLTGIFAFIDTNKNLDILLETKNQHWSVSLWMEIWNNPDITQISYHNMISPTRQLEVMEVTLKPTSVEGKMFTAKMPFSWLIFDKIQKVLTNVVNSEDDKDDHNKITMTASKIFRCLPLGKVICSEEISRNHDVLKCYIEDFVHMAHPFHCEDECKLVCENVVIGCRILLKGEYGNLLPSMIACHVVYDLNGLRFKTFSNIVCVWPNCCERILQVQQTQQNNLVTTEEITLDVLALALLMDNIKPSRETLYDPVSRTNWLRKICEYRPVIERMLEDFQSLYSEDDSFYRRCQNALKKIRCDWTRTFVVKLFIENLCTHGIGTEILPSMKLWSKLGENTNMKEISSLEKVEAHLIKQNAEILKKCFGFKSKCCFCGADLQDMPVQLPCTHTICKKCYIQIIKKTHSCELCEENIPVDFTDGDFINREEVEKYEHFRSRCNSFFMEVVSQLCFSEKTLPSQNVMDKLLSYIIGIDKSERGETVVSKQLTVFQDAIDPNPVVRSFLLQQIIQTSATDIKQHLSKYFNDTTKLLKTSGGETEIIELCLLILQCMEDALQQRHQKLRGSPKELTEMTKMLYKSVEGLTESSGILELIESISTIKYGLSVVAIYIQKTFSIQQQHIQLNAETRHLFEAAAQLCDHCKSSWPRCYFVKELCRNFGTDIYQTILEKDDVEHLKWVRLPDIDVKECCDRYIVNGTDYTDIRDAIAEMILNRNCENLTTILQSQTGAQWQSKINFLLALHRELTMNYLYTEEPKKISRKTQEFVTEYIQATEILADEKDISMSILINSVWKKDDRMNVYPTMDIGQQNIVCLLFHYRILISMLPGRTTLIMPLKNIASHPEVMVDSYFPTMPEDDVEFLTKVMRDFSKDHNLLSWHEGEDTPTIYKCPQGHPYAIGDCGNPFSIFTCFCGEQIGGRGHVLLPGNKETSSAQATTKGHVLGRAPCLKTTDISIPRNDLNKASFAMLRLLTHLSMYQGAEHHIEAILQSIHTEPQIEESDVPSFILQHIELDIESLHQILGRGRDDILLLIHQVLSDIVNYHTFSIIGGEHYPEEICKLSNRTARSNWEELFDKTFILPVLKDMDDNIKKCNDRMADDKRMGSDPLFVLLHEKQDTTANCNVETLHENPEVWRYRARITVDHLAQVLNSREEKYQMLHLFFKEEYHLRVLRLIPNIVRLQKLLTKKFGRKLDRTEGAVLTIEKIEQQMEQDGILDKFRTYLESYSEAWDAVRQSLELYSCRANGGILRVNKGHCRRLIDSQTPICYLLPAYKDTGLCAYLTLRFLLEKQNTFLDEYCRHRHILYSSLPRIHVKGISTAHLISYHPDKDLLPLILANCNYSFEVGHGTKVEYNFSNLERQIMDRFLFSKSVIVGLNEIDVFTYRSENTNSAVLNELSRRILQEKLPEILQSQLAVELRKVPFSDLCRCLDTLDVAISFLKSVGHEKPQTLLYDFMTNILKMEKSFPSQKAQQSVKCCHAMSWWMTLALERATSLMKYNEEPFDGIADTFTKPLTEKQNIFLEKTFSTLPVDVISSLVELMFEFIILNIDVQIDQEDELYVNISDKSLCEYLKEFPDVLPYNEQLAVDLNVLKVIDSLTTDQDNEYRITIGQSVDFWTFINNVLITKQDERS